MKTTINDLLIHIIRSINKDNKEQVIAMVKDVIIPMMAKEQSKKPDQTVKEPEQKKPKQTINKPDQKKPAQKKPAQKKPAQSGNNHKSEKENDLEDWEKDLIRREFIKVNGEITRDFCVEIKKKLDPKTAIFQVTGFVSRLHRYVVRGDLILNSPEHYYYFQYLKKYGERDYKRSLQSGNNNSKVMTITHN